MKHKKPSETTNELKIETNATEETQKLQFLGWRGGVKFQEKTYIASTSNGAFGRCLLSRNSGPCAANRYGRGERRLAVAGLGAPVLLMTEAQRHDERLSNAPEIARDGPRTPARPKESYLKKVGRLAQAVGGTHAEAATMLCKMLCGVGQHTRLSLSEPSGPWA